MNNITIATTTARNTVEADTYKTLAEICSENNVDLTGMTVVFNGAPVSVENMTRTLEVLDANEAITIKVDAEEGNNMLVVVPAMKAGC